MAPPAPKGRAVIAFVLPTGERTTFAAPLLSMQRLDLAARALLQRLTEEDSARPSPYETDGLRHATIWNPSDRWRAWLQGLPRSGPFRVTGRP